jgi:hypothetical protein
MEELFLAALELPDAGQRKEFLDRECDGALRAEVDEYLSIHPDAESYFAEMTLQLNQMLPMALKPETDH